MAAFPRLTPALAFALTLTALTGVPTSASHAETVVFAETFGVPDGGSPPSTACNPDFPADWARHNVDARTPNTQVSWMQSDAWVVRENFVDDVTNCVAFSTSYYTPVGAANDWLLTPPITLPAHPVLRFRSKVADPLYPDGFEVRWVLADPTDVSGASPAFDTATYLPTMQTNAPLLTVAAEASTWTSHELTLNALAGQRVRIAFRNTSNDQFLLLLDDVQVVDKIVNDGAITAALRPHAHLLRLPVILAQPLQLGATLRNVGIQPLTNAIVTAHVKLNGTEIHAVSAPTVATLAPDAAVDVTMPGYVVTQPGVVTVEYTLAADMDDAAANDALTSDAITITTTELGADNATPTSPMGIGDPNGGQIGTVYTLTQATYVRAIRVFTHGASATLAGDAIVGEIYSTTGSPRQPNAFLAQTLPYVVPSPPVGGFVDLPLATPLALPPGDYYFGVVEPIHDSGETDTLDLGLALQLYEPNRNWVRFAATQPGWATLESFGATFARALMLRVLLAHEANLSATLTMPASVTVGATFSATVSVSNAGPDAADDVVLSLPLPAGTGFVSASGSGWTCGVASGTLTCTRASLAVGSAPALTVTLTAPASATTLAATATLTASSVDPDGASATASTLVTTAPPVTFTDPALQATVSGGGASCGFAHAQVLDRAARPAPPDGVVLLTSLLDFRLSGCDATPVTVTLTYPHALPPNAAYWKYHDSTASWAPYAGAVISGNTVTLTVQDGGAGDDDGIVNGEIVDPGAAAAPAGSAVPGLGTGALMILAALLGAAAGTARRRIHRRRG